MTDVVVAFIFNFYFFYSIFKWGIDYTMVILRLYYLIVTIHTSAWVQIYWRSAQNRTVSLKRLAIETSQKVWLQA